MRLAPVSFVVMLAAASLLVGCDKGPDNLANAKPAPVDPPAPVAATASASAVAKPRRSFRGAGGPGEALFRAAESVDMDDRVHDALEQRLLDAAEPSPEFKAIYALLIAGVRAGKIDTAKLREAQVAMDKLTQARRDREAEALGELHAALSPAQRKQVSADARKVSDEQDVVTVKLAAFDKSKDVFGRKQQARLERMTKAFELDAAQQDNLKPVVMKDESKTMADLRAQEKTSFEAILTAFERDALEAKKLDAYSARGKNAHAKMDREVASLSRALPILTASQREKLAVRMMDNGHESGVPGGYSGWQGPAGHKGYYFSPVIGSGEAIWMRLFDEMGTKAIFVLSAWISRRQ